MMQVHTQVLSDDKRVMWAKAGATFPGEKLNEVVTRALADLPKDRGLVSFYEIRRTDVPMAFDALLKLQKTGAACRYIETDDEEYREVLRVELTLLDAIMCALALLLDVILGILSPIGSGGGMPPLAAMHEAPAAPDVRSYVPNWKRPPQKIKYDEPSL